MATSSVPSPAPMPSPGVRLRRIMVAYDFSAFSESAIAYARAFAKFFQAEILLVHAEDVSEEVEDSLTALRAVHQQNVEDMEAVAARLMREGILCQTKCRSGYAPDVLVQIAAETRPDLLILGAFSKMTAMRERMGSTAEYIMRSVPCATLTIGPQAMLMGRPAARLHTILYASSFPPVLGSPLRVTEAIAIITGSEVEVAHVVERHGTAAAVHTWGELDAEGQHIVDQFRALGIAAHGRLLEGMAGNALTERASAIGAGLIVFGIERPTTPASWAAVISQTVHRASCPVLSVPGPA